MGTYRKDTLNKGQGDSVFVTKDEVMKSGQSNELWRNVNEMKYDDIILRILVTNTE